MAFLQNREFYSATSGNSTLQFPVIILSNKHPDTVKCSIIKTIHSPAKQFYAKLCYLAARISCHLSLDILIMFGSLIFLSLII